jgi:hypothetical protein
LSVHNPIDLFAGVDLGGTFVKIVRELSLDEGFDVSMLRGVGLAAPVPVF